MAAARGVVVAQFGEEPRKHPLSLRLTQTERDRLDRALTEERKAPKNKDMTSTALGQYLLGLGLTTYEARDKAGMEKFREVTASHGGDEGAALTDLLQRGFASWDAESKTTPKDRKR